VNVNHFQILSLTHSQGNSLSTRRRNLYLTWSTSLH